MSEQRQSKGLTVRELCFKWLTKAFEAGQTCGRFSDQASEYWSPAFEYEWSPAMEKELADAMIPKAERTAEP